MQLHIKKFDLNKVHQGAICLLIARRRSGKSTLVTDILYNKRDIPVGTIISPTEESNGTYGNHVPALFIHKEYTPKLIENVVKRQKKIIQAANKEIAQYGRTSIDPRAFLIMDDCMYDNSWKKDRNISFIFMNGRHIKLTFILTLQYLKGIGPSFRNNADFIFILRENFMSARKMIYESFCGMFPNYQMFEDVFSALTTDYSCMVIDNTVTSNKLEDQIFWFKADIRENFRVGSKEFWMAQEQYGANEQDDDEDDQFDLEEFNKNIKRKSPTLNVKKTY